MRRWRWAFVVGVLALAALSVAFYSCRAIDRGDSASSIGTLDRNATHRGHRLREAHASISGTVVDGSHVVIPRARVCGQISDESEGRTGDPHCVTANDLGAFELLDLVPAEYALSTLAEGHLPGRRDGIDLHAGEHRGNVELVMQVGGVLVTGTVLDLGGGPISHAEVTAFSSVDYASTASVETNDAGEFRMTLWASNIGVSARAEGYVEQSEFGTAPGVFVLALTPASSIAGMVIDARTHAPVADAAVELTDAATGFGSDVTDDQGQFRIDRLAPGRYAAIARASHGFGRSDGSVRVGLGQHVENLVISLEPAANVDGRLVVDGAPPTACAKPFMYLSRGEHRDDLYGHTTGDGGVRVDGVVPGTYDVGVVCEGHELVGDTAKLEVGVRDISHLKWKFVSVAKGTVRGRVLDSSGIPVAGALVSSDRITDTSKSDGSYELAGLPLRDVRLDVRSSVGVAPKSGWVVTVTGSTTTKDLILEQSGGIVVKVVDPEGNPVEGVTVIVADLSRKTSKDGSLRCDNLPAGTVYVYAQAMSASGQLRREVTVRAGQVSTVQLVAAMQPGKISGVVVGASSQPRGDVFVVASPEFGGTADTHGLYSGDEHVLTGVDGAFSIAGLAYGSYAVRAYEGGGGETIVEHVKPGASLRIQIKSAGSIKGTVHTTAGTSDDFTVRAVDLHTSLIRQERFYKSGGHYSFDELPAGTYQISAIEDAIEGGTTAVLAEGGKLTNVDVTLDDSVTITGRVVDLATKSPVAELHVQATLAGGQQSHDDDTDHDGRFTIAGLPAGALDIEISRRSEYSSVQIHRSCRGVVDLGDLVIAKRRYKSSDQLGRIGVTLADGSLRIEEIDPTGPAAKTVLVVGDIITSVDGIDVTNIETDTARSLLYVPVGTLLRLGLARGVTVSIVTEPWP